MFSGFVQIGFVGKAHGLDGELKVSLEDYYVEDFYKTKAVFIKMRGQLLPYFIENIRGELFPIVKFEDISDRNAAVLIANKELYLRESDIIPDDEREFETEEEPGYVYLRGYAIRDAELGQIGNISNVVEMPQQAMALVNYKNREVMIPLNPAFITEIRKKEKLVLMDLPAGLLDL
ncbi:MAG TPA: ribosome maturation factor RimM [Saprospiraceae bacterium]|nr:ribosome maturation factor RimM [Saprospiraceae bacterium]